MRIMQTHYECLLASHDTVTILITLTPTKAGRIVAMRSSLWKYCDVSTGIFSVYKAPCKQRVDRQ